MPKLEKSTDHSHKLISSEDGQDTSAYKISGQSLHAFSGKCPETSPDGRTDGQTDGRTDGQTDGHAVKRLRLVGWTNGPMYRSKEGISGFGRTDGGTDGRTDGRTDGQPENIMPPAPKGGGITKITYHQSYAMCFFHHPLVPVTTVTGTMSHRRIIKAVKPEPVCHHTRGYFISLWSHLSSLLFGVYIWLCIFRRLKHIESETKWTPFRRRHFQALFFNEYDRIAI